MVSDYSKELKRMVKKIGTETPFHIDKGCKVTKSKSRNVWNNTVRTYAHKHPPKVNGVVYHLVSLVYEEGYGKGWYILTVDPWLVRQLRNTQAARNIGGIESELQTLRELTNLDVGDPSLRYALNQLDADFIRVKACWELNEQWNALRREQRRQEEGNG